MKKTLTLYSHSPYSSKTKSGARSRNHQLRKKMERNGVSPSEQVIRNILNYSLALTVLSTREKGLRNLVMN